MKKSEAIELLEDLKKDIKNWELRLDAIIQDINNGQVDHDELINILDEFNHNLVAINI